jgi:DNA primase
MLRQMGLQKVKRKGGTRPGFIACCPFHNENTPSFSIGDNGLWMCWTCGVKGNLKQLQKKMGMEVPDDWRFNLKMAQISLEGRRRRVDAGYARATLNMPDGFSTYSMPAEVPAVIAKRLKWETIEAYHLGSVSSAKDWRLRDRCVIPIYYGKKCVGYHARALKPDTLPRYYNPDGFPIKNHVFNFDGCVPGQELIVCEGAFNAMSMVEKGFTNTLSTFGTNFTAPQIAKITELGPSSITICFDRDKSKVKEGKEVGRGGQRAAMKLGAILSDFMKVEIMPLPLEKDPNDLPAEKLVECHAKRVAFEMFKR